MATKSSAGAGDGNQVQQLRDQRAQAEQAGDTAETARLDEQIRQAEQGPAQGGTVQQ